jgi:GT2 family glycosyltransferase
MLSCDRVGVASGRTAVAIVNYNGGAGLARCLDGLSRQERAPDRTLVVDNASGDGSADAVSVFRGVELIRLSRNVGFAAANNLAARAADDCEFLALLNPDAVPAPAWLSELLAAADRCPEAAAFGSRLVWARDPALLDGTGDVYHVSGRVWRQGHRKPDHEEQNVSREIFSPCAAAALYRQAAFREAGGFDEEFFCYLEDVDLGFRLRLLGHRCIYVPASVATHEGGATAGSHSDFAVYHGHRNLVWTWFRNMPLPLLALYLPQHLLLNVVTLAWFGLQGRIRVILRAKRDALLGLPRVLKERALLQSQRRVGSLTPRSWMTHGVLQPYLVPLSREDSRE